MLAIQNAHSNKRTKKCIHNPVFEFSWHAKKEKHIQEDIQFSQ